MKYRRHHNNKGQKQIRSHKTLRQVQFMAKRLGIPFSFLKSAKKREIVECINLME